MISPRDIIPAPSLAEIPAFYLLKRPRFLPENDCQITLLKHRFDSDHISAI